MPTREEIEREMDEYVEGDSWPEAADETGLRPVPVKDVAQASGVVRRLKRLDRERQTHIDVRDAEIRRVTQFCEDRISGIDREIEWGKRSLRAFMVRYKEQSHKGSLKLADGTPKLTKPSSRTVVVDERAFLEFAFGAVDGKVKLFPELPDKTTRVDFDPADPYLVPAHPELIRAKYSLIADAVKDLARTDPPGDEVSVDEEITREAVALPDGTIIPGIEIQTPKEDTFDVKIGAD